MASLLLLALMISVPMILFIGWLLLSSCLGDNTRARLRFDRNYMRTITSSGQGTWNQIEMEDMLGDEDGDEAHWEEGSEREGDSHRD
ncbi:hypothetical protein HYFRA_00004696 [Hymenoscyphus fraxineus]|uniref:Uncharacterized protein n=1 Tax=Hymenoscyphus fraxineus TaxID=746836 RepID=A0A9N9PPL4_9HELO|nr:hypothetical protein HYFRA_00004696 [Hymenoscyphus fraxineus]